MKDEMNSYYTPFGRMLRKMMGTASQQEFADSICVPVQTLNNWLTGKVGVPQDRSLVGLAEVSGFSLAKIRGLIASSDASEDELNKAFETPISNPGEAIAMRLSVYQAELNELLSILDPTNEATHHAVRDLLQAMRQIETAIEKHTV